MHQQLDATGARIGEQVAVVGLRGTEDLHHAGEQPIRSGAHVDGLHGQPHRLDADHRSHSRSQATHSLAASAGQAMLIVVVPRRNSMRMSGSALGARVAGSCSATKASPDFW